MGVSAAPAELRRPFLLEPFQRGKPGQTASEKRQRRGFRNRFRVGADGINECDPLSTKQGKVGGAQGRRRSKPAREADRSSRTIDPGESETPVVCPTDQFSGYQPPTAGQGAQIESALVPHAGDRSPSSRYGIPPQQS